jgi:hypothetical protein
LPAAWLKRLFSIVSFACAVSVKQAVKLAAHNGVYVPYCGVLKKMGDAVLLLLLVHTSAFNEKRYKKAVGVGIEIGIYGNSRFRHQAFFTLIHWHPPPRPSFFS